MPSVSVDPARIHEFAEPVDFHAWLAAHHASEDEVWIMIHKVKSGLRSVNPAEAIEVALCWGWIDAIRKRYDDKSFLQRYTRRGRKSTWSQINVDNVARLIAEDRMSEHGLAQVNAAKADGRWARAYASGKAMKIPADLQAAIEVEPAARAMLPRLSEKNRFALAFQTHNMRTEAGRKRKIKTLVAMLMSDQTIYPQREREHDALA